MADSERGNKKCRKCGKFNLKIYEDGSGFCLDCNDSFADVNDYGEDMKNVITANENIFSKRTEQPVVSKWKDPQQYVAALTVLNVLFGLGFLVIGIWNLILFLSDGWFESFIITFILCGCLLVISGLSIEAGDFKRASYITIVVTIMLLFQGVYYVYNKVFELDAFCICPIAFLLFIVISAYMLLRLDKGARK